jgi:mRNA interferase MazF
LIHRRVRCRCALVAQADGFLDPSTTIVAPTSRGASPATFRPVINVDGEDTRVLAKQATVVDPQRLGQSAGRLEASEPLAVDEALSLILGL